MTKWQMKDPLVTNLLQILNKQITKRGRLGIVAMA